MVDLAFAAQPFSLSNPDSRNSFNHISAFNKGEPFEFTFCGSYGFRIPNPISVTRSREGFPLIDTTAPSTSTSGSNKPFCSNTSVGSAPASSLSCLSTLNADMMMFILFSSYLQISAASTSNWPASDGS